MTRFAQVIILLLAVSAIAAAQMDPPSRVGRLNYLSGSVSFQPSGVTEWTAADINRPLTTGDQVWSDADSRAEIQIGTASMHIGSRTAFQFLNLDDRTVQVRLTEGVLSVHVRQLDPNETFEVDTPNQAFSLIREGDYRIEADPDHETTTIIVFQGQGEVTGGGQAINIPPGSLAAIRGDQQISHEMHPAPEPDAWDHWCLDRINREERSEAARYVPPEMIGSADLDTHGVWQESPYGMVWAPRTVMVGWAPYRYGRWAWIEPWGWTWVDDAPWGFAPFHYGRWAYWNSGWVWVPGSRTVRPVYSPAMVAWVGGSSFGISVGWVPLGPREVYYPGYRTSPAYLNRINGSNTVIVTNRRFLNAAAPNGISAVEQRDMAMGRHVQQVFRPVNARQLEEAQVLNTAPVRPEHAALVGPAGRGRVSAPPAAVYSRPVVARSALPAASGNRDAGFRPMIRQAPPVNQPVIQAQPGLQSRPQGGPQHGWRTITPPPAAAQRPAASQPPVRENRQPAPAERHQPERQRDEKRQQERPQRDSRKETTQK